MTCNEIAKQLHSISLADDFECASTALTGDWSAAGIGIECIEPILRFIEENPELDYGIPGPLVPFIEEFYLNGYKEYVHTLIESVRRRPTILTAWMLNRVVNITEDLAEKEALMHVMRQAVSDPKADKATRAGLQMFLGD